MNEASAFWTAIQVQRNSFRVAERALVRQGFDVFAPQVERLVRRFGRDRTDRRLLFPGYIFATVDEERTAWRSILGTPGVSRIIRNGSRGPARLPIEFVNGLRTRCNPSGLLLPPREVGVGDRLRVTKGPFADLIATVERIDEMRRVRVLLQILGGEREVQISLDDTQTANA